MAETADSDSERDRPFMTRALVLIAALLGLGLPAATQSEPAQDLPPLEVQDLGDQPIPAGRLEKVEAYLNGLESLEADFVQQAPDGTVSRGTLKLSRPGRLRFDYGGEPPILIVSDGEVLTFVDYEVGQVTRWPIDETPLGILVAEQVDFDDGSLQVQAGPGALPNMIAVQARSEAYEDLGFLTLTFADRGAEGMALLGWEAVDAQGFATRVVLRDVETGKQFAKATWDFDDPRKIPARRGPRGR